MRRKPSNLCCVKFCRHRTKDGRSKCDRCRKREWRQRHPIAYLFDNLRTHARTRGIAFRLTIHDFMEFCRRTSYHVFKGQDPHSLSINRKRPWDGYQADNIEAMAHGANSGRAFDRQAYQSQRRAG